MRRVVASCLGLGLLPRRLWGHDGGAGTLGAVGAATLAVPLGYLGAWPQVAGLVAVIGLCLWSVRPYATDGADPPWICIDEAAGVFVSMVGLSEWAAIVVAFSVFRVVDIAKRLPLVDRAQRLPGAGGVLADDLVAGGYGLAAGWLVQVGFSSLG